MLKNFDIFFAFSIFLFFSGQNTLVETGILLIVVESLWLVVVETIVVKTVVVETGFLVVVETLGLYPFKIFEKRKISYSKKNFFHN